MTIRRLSLALVFLLGSTLVSASGQVPQHEKIHFDANKSFELIRTKRNEYPAASWALPIVSNTT